MVRGAGPEMDVPFVRKADVVVRDDVQRVRRCCTRRLSPS